MALGGKCSSARVESLGIKQGRGSSETVVGYAAGWWTSVGSCIHSSLFMERFPNIQVMLDGDAQVRLTLAHNSLCCESLMSRAGQHCLSLFGGTPCLNCDQLFSVCPVL